MPLMLFALLPHLDHCANNTLIVLHFPALTHLVISWGLGLSEPAPGGERPPPPPAATNHRSVV
jgi:hypothetical protein